MNKFYLPQIKEIKIVEFDLYKCPLVINFNSKLNIIFGTNGTGKSTLLMLILFSIIGPYRGGIKTKTRNEQRKDNRPCYSEDFFRNRTESLSDNGEIISKFVIDMDEYVVKHSLYDGRLLEAWINNQRIEGKVVSYKTYEMKYSKVRENKEFNEKELEGYLIYNYQNKIKESTRLPGGINTLISMLLDVMFFDESRKFTFWNSDLQETIIGKYIVDKEFYEKYCEKKLDTKALESAYKKASETANFMMQFLEKEKQDSDNKEEYDEKEERIKLMKLEGEINKDKIEVENRQIEYNKANDMVFKVMREIEQIKEEIQKLDEIWYENLFPSQYAKYYKKFSKKMLDDICPICGQNHSFSIETEKCILCNKRLEISTQPDLVRVDIQRKDKQNLLNAKNKELEKIKNKLANDKKEIHELKRQLEEKNSKKNQIEIALKPSNNIVEDNDAKRLDKARRNRDEALKRLNESKKEEGEMKKIIENSLADNFRTFSQIFTKHAHSFFGVNHNVKLYLPFSNEDTIDDIMIKFELDGKDREESFMLSESQRIFTDLAFRFAILTTFHDKSFFICETPDSTLDLFHENNAVNTFKEYIKTGNTLILTANARKSNLISKLYNEYADDEKYVIDLTQLSRLRLEEKVNFFNYVEGEW